MKKTIIFIFASFIIIFLLFSFLFFIKTINPKDITKEEFLPFSIEKGEGIILISENLQKSSFIKNRYSFIIYAFLSGQRRSLQAGEYLLSPSMGVKDIIVKLSKGDTIKKRITIIEGWNIEDIGNYLAEQEICSKEEFFNIVNEDFSDQFSFLKDKPKNLNLEGYLFPDTYEMNINSSCRDIVFKMLSNFKEKIDNTSIKGKTIFEIINMASLIEKEVRTFEDKKIVSGILWKRLEIGMPLQVDATIAYITKKKTTRISLEELKIDSPYNTYLYKGLPLGPISNPGLSSIVASINPEKSDFLFYLSTLEGETVFSRNLTEHNIAKQKYLK
ncbi:MAG: endolytic transglycosylase MltG [Candidatus Pacebacteria bacterium]|nr:endolytic transglycosylase MltG [Candidatus Paceibacterota bacterium]MDD3728921.1 endolytic transglycosylase MltG [Candidatus Paceibacterota bacterium]MDD4467246.1 endolytic transglycosylase MltG [Candidatus Paceibacterota bacterium]MDD4897404.1 endolytic transglycosylase MltG [Candidatus Paceibacterota bacterium]MDD5446170.1 endolytic transglycosylase MltG [Candidatus Paceibacterota bacterium]